MSSINTLNILNKNSEALAKSLAKVSSGMKINSAADDASGYAGPIQSAEQQRLVPAAMRRQQKSARRANVIKSSIIVSTAFPLRGRVAREPGGLPGAGSRRLTDEVQMNKIRQINERTLHLIRP
ncbi:MAG: hypothetical protein E7200_02675 [Selenomonas ruminantium]|nr:hypothetical protein [Selenomonas ruminantium]